jgi:hypothetical protein
MGAEAAGAAGSSNLTPFFLAIFAAQATFFSCPVS